MINIVIDKPYQFVPPRHDGFWPALLRLYMPGYLRRSHGVESFEYLHLDRLKASRDAGHGIMLAPNHCRPCDPMVLGLMTAGLTPLYIMASWHLFMQNRFQTWLLPRIGVFSVYREGLDREALKCAVEILVQARRPLVVFPEGAVSRTNDHLNHLMDGTAFMARQAAKQRAAVDSGAKVVIHPLAIRYFFKGDVEKTVLPILQSLEERLSWQPQTGLALPDRVAKIGDALLTLKELEYAEKPHAGSLAERLAALIDQLLGPLEDEWLKGRREGDVTGRVKALRTALLPGMVAGDVSEEERSRRWRQLADVYLAQQVALYPPGYFSDPPTPEQLLETVERFEEDSTDSVAVHRPFHAAVEVGEAIEVAPKRERGLAEDPVMAEVRASTESMLASLKARRPSS